MSKRTETEDRIAALKARIARELCAEGNRQNDSGPCGLRYERFTRIRSIPGRRKKQLQDIKPYRPLTPALGGCRGIRERRDRERMQDRAAAAADDRAGFFRPRRSGRLERARNGQSTARPRSSGLIDPQAFEAVGSVRAQVFSVCRRE